MGRCRDDLIVDDATDSGTEAKPPLVIKGASSCWPRAFDELQSTLPAECLARETMHGLAGLGLLCFESDDHLDFVTDRTILDAVHDSKLAPLDVESRFETNASTHGI